MQFDDVGLARLRDPATPAEDLAAAWRRVETAFNRAVPLADEMLAAGMAIAGNPNAPAKMLDRAATHFPLQVLQNPVLPLLAIEDPLFSDFSHGNLAHLVAAAEMVYRSEVRHLLKTALNARYAKAEQVAPATPSLHLAIPWVDIQKMEAEMKKVTESMTANIANSVLQRGGFGPLRKTRL